MFISKKKFFRIMRKVYELGWRMKQIEQTNRGFIIAGATKFDQELDEIIRKEKF